MMALVKQLPPKGSFNMRVSLESSCGINSAYCKSGDEVNASTRQRNTLYVVNTHLASTQSLTQLLECKGAFVQAWSLCST